MSSPPTPLFPETSRVSPTAKIGAKTIKHRHEASAVPDLVDSIIQQGLARRASDIHLESGEKGLLVRFRVDGMLQDVCELPAESRAAVIARIKIMGGMDITEHRLPQDGRIKIREKVRSVDIRISSLPSLYGEKVVMRLLDLDNTALPLTSTGLAEDNLKEMSRLIRRPQGVIFVTGPTGSGKTSTL